MGTIQTYKTKGPNPVQRLLIDLYLMRLTILKLTKTMKTYLSTKTLKLILLTFLIPLCKVSAQNITLVESRPGNMTVCMGNYPFSVKIKNNTASPVSSMQLRLDLPDYINYTGNLSNASEWNTANLNEPVFSIPEIAAHDSVMISYTAEASCGIINSMSNNLTVQNKYGFSYQLNGNTINQPASSFQSYNLLYANLSLNVLNPITTNLLSSQRINHLSPQYRTIHVINGGNGSIDTVLINITPEPEITYNGFIPLYNQDTVLAFTQLVNELEVKLYGQALRLAIGQSGNNDLLFDPGESISLIEDFIVNHCASGNSLYKVQWGCRADVCNASASAGNATTNSNISVHTGNAQFDIFTGNTAGQLSYCDNDGMMEFYFVNTGTHAGDFARNLEVDIISYEGNTAYILPVAFELFDYSINGLFLDTSLITPRNTISWHPPKNSTTTPGYHIDFSQNTMSGILEDLDGDGFYDDLGQGDTLKITVKVRYPAFTELDTECPLNILHNYGLPQISWLTTCGEPRTSIDGNSYYLNRYLAYNYPDQQTLTDLIIEPVDFIEGQPETFTFCTGTWNNNWSVLDCPVNEYKGIVNLPAGYHLNNPSVTWFSSAGDSIGYTAAEIGNQVIIDGGGRSNLPNNQHTWTGCFDVELVLLCPAEGGLSSLSTISWELQYKCDDCDILQRRVCASEDVYNHASGCPGTQSLCTGIFSSDFEVERTTLGWTDASRTQHVSDTTPGLRLDAGYAFDGVQSTSVGMVVNTGFDNVFVDIAYSSGIALFSFLDAHFNIYRNGSLSASCAAASPVQTINEGIFNNRFEMPCMDLLLPEDSIAFVANWTITTNPLINKNREYEIPDFRSRFVSTDGSDVFACDSWGERFTLVSNNTFPLATMGTNPSGCGNLTINLNWMNWGGGKENDFPYEFRNIGKLDNIIRFAMPEGYTFVEQSARMFAYTANETIHLPHFYTDAVTILSPTFSANGDTLIFNEEWPLVDKAGQGQISYLTPPTLTFEIKPGCNHNDTVLALMDFKYTNNQYIENTVLQQEISWENTWHDDSNIPGTNMYWHHYLPNLLVNTGLATVDAYASTVSWDLQICNKKDAGHPVIVTADGVWMDIDNMLSNEGNVLINSIEQLETNTSFSVSEYNNGSSAFFEIGSIAANVCRTYRINASYTNCSPDEVDSIRVLTGWNCGAYPEPALAETASCHVDTSYFMIRYKTANLQMAIDEPAGIYEVCDTLTYQLTLTSSEPANMYDIRFWTNLPDGARIIHAEYQYPETATAWNSLDQYTSAGFEGYNPQGWDLSAVVPQFHNGFMGNRFQDENEIRLRFNVILDCTYNPGQQLLIFARGQSNCHDSLALNAHYSLPVFGFENSVNYTLSNTVEDSLNCLGPNTIAWTVANTSDHVNMTGDSLRVELPEGFSFVAGSGLPANPVLSGNMLSWPVGLMAANSSKTFSFRMDATALDGCLSITLPAELFRSRNSSCNENCEITASWKDTARTVFCCRFCPANAIFSAANVCVGSSMCFVAGTPMPADEYTHSWNFGDGSYSTQAEPCHLYGAAGSYPVTHVVRNSDGCSDSVTLMVTVTEMLTADIVLLGSNPFCSGTSVQLVVDVAHTSIEWMNETGVIGTQDTLTVTSGGTYTAILYDGACSTSTSEELIEKDLPLISLPDTLLCSSADVISLDAGADFASYTWSTGETSQTIVAGPGSYWVRAGEASCLSIDSVTVGISNLDVSLHDTVMCTSSPITLNAVVSGGFPGYSYSWSTSAATQQCTAVSPGAYSVTITDAMGCTAGASMTVGQDESGTADFFLEDTVCLLDTACFLAVETQAYHQWNLSNSNGSPFVSFGNFPEFCFQFPNPGSYTIEHITDNGCSRDTVSKIITVIPPIEACIVMIGQNPFCQGDTVYLTTNDPYNQVQHIDWYRDGVYLGTMDTLTVTRGGSYTAIVVDYNGCSNSCMCMVLTQNPVPVIKLPKHLYVCSNGNEQVAVASGNASFQWFQDGILLGAGPELTISEAGIYVVEATGPNGCTVTDSLIVLSRAVYVSLQASSYAACVGTSVELTATCDPNYSYEWQKLVMGNWVDLIGSGCHISVPVIKTGQNSYRVIIRDELSGCRATETIVVEGVKTGCYSVVVSPNPTEKQWSSIYYTLDGTNSKSIKLEIFNMRGELVKNQALDSNSNKADLDFSGYAEGIYLIRVLIDGEFLTTEKIMVLGQ